MQAKTTAHIATGVPYQCEWMQDKTCIEAGVGLDEMCPPCRRMASWRPHVPDDLRAYGEAERSAIED